MSKVSIFGGGITGLTIAHECLDAGLEVHLYESANVLGGKAVGTPNDGFPLEHAPRIIANRYFSFFETLFRVPLPTGKGTLMDNVIPVANIRLASGDIDQPVTLGIDLLSVISRLWSLTSYMRKINIPWSELIYTFGKCIMWIWSCDDRKNTLSQTLTIGEYLNLETKSQQYRNFIVKLMGIITAAKVTAACDVSVEVLCTLLLSILIPGTKGISVVFSVSNGPTSDAIIDPWVAHLVNKGLKIHLNSLVVGVDANRIRLRIGDQVDQIVPSQHNLCAFAFSYHDTKSLNLITTQGDEENTQGFSVYLKTIPEHLNLSLDFHFAMDSPWDIAYVVRTPDTWKTTPFDPSIKGLVNIIVSQFQVAGKVHGKTFIQCNLQEIQDEFCSQIGLDSSAIHSIKLGYGINYVPANQPSPPEWIDFAPNTDNYKWTTSMPIFILTPDFAKAMPPITSVNSPYIFTVGEFTDSPTIVPTMEKANEVGKLCASEIYTAAGLTYPKSRLHVPYFYGNWIRSLDSIIFNLQQAGVTSLLHRCILAFILMLMAVFMSSGE
jgi:hypothetical protein